MFYEETQFARQEVNTTDYDVIVIGAGASGIGAAITLQRAGVRYLIIQARNRIGGRLQSAIVDEVQMDLGGCWVHCYNKNNVIFKEVKRLGWQSKQSVDHQRSQNLDQITGHISNKVMSKAQFHCKKFLQISQKIAKKSEFDLSIQQAGQKYYKNQIEKQSKEVKRVIDMLINQTEHQNGASITQLSARNYDQGIDDGKDFSPKHSYAALMQAIAADLKVQLNTRVKQIEYCLNKVKIICDNQIVYTARKVVCSLPLGVLKAGTIKFIPQLPNTHKMAIQRLGFGVMNKIIMAFEQPFWDIQTSWVCIACEERGKYPMMYNFSKDNKNILCCFITDNFSKKISEWTNEEIINDILQTLKQSFKGKKIVLKEFKITRWNKDPFSLGSYTYFHKNSSAEDCYNLRRNIKETLWIVGEHCYAQYIGAAHGAFQTGVWASQEIINKLKSCKISK